MLKWRKLNRVKKLTPMMRRACKRLLLSIETGKKNLIIVTCVNRIVLTARSRDVMYSDDLGFTDDAVRMYLHGMFKQSVSSRDIKLVSISSTLTG